MYQNQRMRVTYPFGVSIGLSMWGPNGCDNHPEEDLSDGNSYLEPIDCWPRFLNKCRSSGEVNWLAEFTFYPMFKILACLSYEEASTDGYTFGILQYLPGGP
jgi:hypothetical protein